MKGLKKLLVIAVVCFAVLYSGCCVLPQTVSRDKYQQAKYETETEEARVALLEQEKSELEAAIRAQEELIQVLREMERERK